MNSNKYTQTLLTLIAVSLFAIALNLWVNSGNALRELIYDEGEILLNNARAKVESDRTNPILRAVLGDTYNSVGRQEQAIAAYKEAIRLDPGYAYPHFKLGVIYRDLGHIGEAVAEYDEISRINPNYWGGGESLGEKVDDIRWKVERLLFKQTGNLMDFPTPP